MITEIIESYSPHNHRFFTVSHRKFVCVYVENANTNYGKHTYVRGM